MKFFIALFLFTCFFYTGFAQYFLPVRFLYGSRPVQHYKFIEPAWFGGKMGGHVGIETGPDTILNFCHHGSFHIISNNKNKHGYFKITSSAQFNSIFGENNNMVKTATVFIPVTKDQLQQADSLLKTYLSESPYDYALFGMRCGAASYDILSVLGILPHYSNTKTFFRIFYPKLLRRKLLKIASEKNWQVIRTDGSRRRVWERD